MTQQSYEFGGHDREPVYVLGGGFGFVELDDGTVMITGHSPALSKHDEVVRMIMDVSKLITDDTNAQ